MNQSPGIKKIKKDKSLLCLFLTDGLEVLDLELYDEDELH